MDKEIADCQYYSFDVPLITVEGGDTAGGIIQMELRSDKNTGNVKYFWIKPDGTIYEGQYLKLFNLGDEHKGKYCGYYIINNNGCRSSKAMIEIKAPGMSAVTVPCNIQDNYFNVAGASGYENIIMPTATYIKKGMPPPHNQTVEITSGSSSTPVVDIEINVPEILEGEYLLTGYNSGHYPSYFIKYAKLRFNKRPATTSDWQPLGGKLYIVKKNGHFEIITCGVSMSMGSVSIAKPLNMKLIVK